MNATKARLYTTATVQCWWLLDKQRSSIEQSMHNTSSNFSANKEAVVVWRRACGETEAKMENIIDLMHERQTEGCHTYSQETNGNVAYGGSSIENYLFVFADWAD